MTNIDLWLEGDGSLGGSKIAGLFLIFEDCSDPSGALEAAAGS